MKLDQSSSCKCARPLPSGRIGFVELLMLSSALVISGFGLIVAGNAYVLPIAILILVNHLAYTLEPLRFKRRILLDVLSGAILTNGLRFLIGFLSVSFRTPALLACATVVFLKVAAYLLYRASDQPDIPNIFHGTVSLLTPQLTSLISCIFYCVSVASFVVYAIRTNLPLGHLGLAFVVFCFFLLLFLVSHSRKKPSALFQYLIYSSRLRKKISLGD